MKTNNWRVPLSKFSDEQRKAIESLLGYSCGWTYLRKAEGLLWYSDSLSEFSEITPDEAFKILGLDRLLEPEQGLQGLSWPDEAEMLVQDGEGGDLEFIGSSVAEWHSKWKVIATRPKPKVKPLTDEQIEAVREFVTHYDWAVKQDSVDVWLKEREQ